MEQFYMRGHKQVNPFTLDGDSTFGGLEIDSENGTVNYHTNGTAPIKGGLAFEYIYRSCDNDIVFIIDAWNMAHIKRMTMYLENAKKMQYYLQYNVKFVKR